MRSWLLRLSSVLSLLLLLMVIVPAGGAQGSRSVIWQRWDVDVTINRDGSFHVIETHVIQFIGEFRFGYRAIPLARTEGITLTRVTENGRPLTRGSLSGMPGTYVSSTNEDNELEITYYFSTPAINEIRTFTIEYDVQGAIRYYEDGDEFDWYAIAPERGWPVLSSTITVRLPEGAAPLLAQSIPDDLVVSVDEDAGVITWQTTRRLGPNESVEVGVKFEHGVLTGSAPAWQAGFDARNHYVQTVKPLVDLGVGALGVLLLILGPAGVYYLWSSRGRDPKIGPVPEYLSEPPSDLPPGVVGTLVDERADLQDIMATLVDLARRGYLIMEETQESGFLGTKSRSFIFHRTDKDVAGLREYEKFLLRKLFGRKSSRSLDTLRYKFYTAIPKLQKMLYQEVVREGFFRDDPDSVRKRWGGIGVFLMALAVALGVLSGILMELVSSLFCMAGALGIIGLALLIAAPRMPAKTRKGAEEAAKWKAFRTYLKRIRQYTDLESATDQFERYLPYAIAFGIEKAWIRTFSRIPTTPMPVWYRPWGYAYAGSPGGRITGLQHPAPGRPDIESQLARPEGIGSIQSLSDGMAAGLQNMSDGLVSLLNKASTTFTSHPQTSGTGGWSRGGGGGWSGGGFGGGGGGGGAAGFG